DAAERQPYRRVEVLGERAGGAPLVRPRIGDKEDVRPVALMQAAGLRAHQQVQFLIELEPLRHLRDHPGPEPMGPRRVRGILGQQIDRNAHPYLPASFGLERRPRFQNTCDEIASAVIRDWRMYWASACMIA